MITTLNGRTGRAGQAGQAISLALRSQIRDIKKIERLIKKDIPIQGLPKDFSLERPRKRTNKYKRGRNSYRARR